MDENGFHFFTLRGKVFAYHINSTYCAEVDDLSLGILQELLSGNRSDIENKFTPLYPRVELRGCVKQCNDLLDNAFFGEELNSYQHQIQNTLGAVSLHISHNCNLRCEYCYADAGSFGGSRQLMSKRVMIKAIDFAFNHAGESLNIGFFGGEPLLNFKHIVEGVGYAKELAKELKKSVSFSMTTNATLMTSSIMRFLNEENFSLIFSIDGPKVTHDKLRKNIAGKGTHARVLNNILEYSRHHSSDFTVRGTFTRTTPNFLDQVTFLNDQGFKSVSVEPAQLNPSNPHSIYGDVGLLRVKREYEKLADIYLERFNLKKPLSFFHFDYYLKKLINPQPIHTQCGAGGGFIAIIPDGRIYPCFEAVVEKENCIGHIDSGFDQKKRRIFQSMYVDKKRTCRECWFRYNCGGGCHAFNIRYNNDIKIPYRPSCELTKYRFMLSTWILSEIIGMGDEAFKKLRTHLCVEET